MQHRYDLKVFLLAKDEPAGPPRPGPTLAVEAPTLDGLLPAAKRALADAGHPRARAFYFTPTGLVAHVEVPA
ncbi:MAG: hypothetical protein IV100_11750 [Myxococcales bacterium]|nr:hypothetical protein [Myxococcales bacterium]